MTATKHFRNDTERWEAVKQRNKAANGQFFYSVKTTGVYCRPSCGSRLARRDNVRFYSSCEDAEVAGFRPCKRCQPRNESFGTENIAIITKACRLIESSKEELSLNELATHAGLSPFHFHRLFKKTTGVTAKSYFNSHRSTNLKKSLQKSDSITKAIFASGYNSSGQFYATSNGRLGMTPKQFRDGAKELEIQYGIGKSSLGNVLIAATEKGICAIFLGDSRDKLIGELKNTFSKAHIAAGSKRLDVLIATIVELVDNPKANVNLPLDIRGTAFQQRVWEQLRKIPIGITTTYSELAKKLRKPNAIRAVARACATNTIAVVIPCHRVIRNDGNLAGYRWGLTRKEKLLDREKAATFKRKNTNSGIVSKSKQSHVSK